MRDDGARKQGRIQPFSLLQMRASQQCAGAGKLDGLHVPAGSVGGRAECFAGAAGELDAGGREAQPSQQASKPVAKLMAIITRRLVLSLVRQSSSLPTAVSRLEQAAGYVRAVDGKMDAMLSCLSNKQQQLQSYAPDPSWRSDLEASLRNPNPTRNSDELYWSINQITSEHSWLRVIVKFSTT